MMGSELVGFVYPASKYSMIVFYYLTLQVENGSECVVRLEVHTLKTLNHQLRTTIESLKLKVVSFFSE